MTRAFDPAGLCLGLISTDLESLNSSLVFREAGGTKFLFAIVRDFGRSVAGAHGSLELDAELSFSLR